MSKKKSVIFQFSSYETINTSNINDVMEFIESRSNSCECSLAVLRISKTSFLDSKMKVNERHNHIK